MPLSRGATGGSGMSPLAGVDERLAFCEKEGLWRMPKGAPKGRRCTICQHPQRPNIDLAIATGISRRLIAARFKVSADAGSRPSSWWRFESGLRWRRHSGLGGNDLPLARLQGSRSTAWRIVLRPERRYQALRLRRTAARLRGLTAALRPSVWHPCRSTAQWIA